MRISDDYEIEDSDTCWILKNGTRIEGWFGSKRGLEIALKERKLKQSFVKDFPDYHRGLL